MDSFDRCLWQDAPPEVQLQALLSREAQSSVSVCKVYSHFRKSRSVPTRAGAMRLPSFTHISGNLQSKPRFPMEDAGLFSLLIVTDEFREKVFNMKKEELNIALECHRWLQEHNI